MVELLSTLVMGSLTVKVLLVVDKEMVVLRAATALSFVNDVLGLDWIFVLKVLFLDLISNVVFLEGMFKGLPVIL